ncbi:hypothetical protein [Vibrio crassostreae]|uniref:hypothetical protein n=1 Tax=Vibrio crassostreae TaxID=246167 RepID=UPI000311A04B|nr:hypothetical protein [Vibrio crassostreae]OEE89400.1 hypothetical protein A140_18660 [Vibrio crassostreae 9ZC88]
MITCKKSAKNEYMVSLEPSEIVTHAIPNDSLLAASIKLLSEKRFTTSTAYCLANAMNIAINHLNSPFIHKLLLEPSHKLSVHDVIAGYKELEHFIEQSSLVKKSPLSSVFRSLMSETGVTMSDDLSIARCMFITRFSKSNRLPMATSPCSSSDIYAIRILSVNTNYAYWTIDPDTLQGVLHPGGLLALSLQHAEAESVSTPIHDALPQGWLLTLQAIAHADNSSNIRHLLNSKPSSLNAKDILKGFTQLEDILQQQNINSPKNKSTQFRKLLSRGGNISHGITVNSCEFNSRFLSKGDKTPTEQLSPPDCCFTIKVRIGESFRYYYQAAQSVRPNSLLGTALTNLSRDSEETPSTYRKFLFLRRALNALSDEGDIAQKCPFLVKQPHDLSTIDIMQGTVAMHEIIARRTNGTSRPEIKELTDFLFKYGELSETAKNALKTKRKPPRESAVILHPSSDELSEFLAPNGLLQTCFSISKWDVLTTDSQSYESYVTRTSISKILSYLVDHQDIPYTRSLLRLPPANIKPRDIYSCYTEIESVLSNSGLSGIGANTFMTFLERNVGDINKGLAFGSIFLFGRLAKENDLLYTPERKFTLQLVHGKDINKKFLPFDPNRLSGLMLPDSLLQECLLASENESMDYTAAMGLRKELGVIAKSNLLSLKALLNSKKCKITSPMIIDGLIEFESMLECDCKHNNRYQVTRSEALRSFLNKWAGEIAGANSLNDLPFTSRFDKNGQVKCIAPFTIKGSVNNGKHSHIQFNTYLNPDIYKADGLLTTSLLAAKQQVGTYPATKLQHWLTLVEHIIENQHRLSLPISAENFLSTPLTKCNRAKAVLALRGIEDLIELRDSADKEADFNALMELFALSNGKIADGRSISELGYRSRFSPEQKKQIIQFIAINKTHGKEKISNYNWDVLPLKNLVPQNGLLMIAIKKAAKKSQVTPVTRNVINNVHIAVKMINNTLNTAIISITEREANHPLRHILVSPANQLSQRDIRLGLTRFEDIVEASSRSNKGKFSENFRRFLSINANPLSNGFKVRDCGFKTRFSARKERNDVELITPVDDKTGKPLPSPIIQNYKSIKELKNQLNNYYQEPIVAITKATRKEMQLYHQLSTELSPLVKRNDDGEFAFKTPDLLQEYVAQIAKGKNEKNGQKLSELVNRFGQKVVLAAFLQLRADTPIEQPIHCEGKSILIHDDYRQWFGNRAPSMKPFFWTPFLLPRQILLMCFIRLIIHTTWNKDVIATLQGKDLPYPLPASRFFIQGNKNKVKKNTKKVEVTPTDNEVREAIELLSIHHKNMVELGLNPETVWDTPDSKNLTFLNSSVIDAFIDRYHLPKFRIEQLAKHQINVRKGVDGSIHQSQIERNHAQLKTTAGYVDHPLARLYYDANNAEFQRRLEATVMFRYSGADSLPEYGLSNSDVDLKLLGNPSTETNVPDWFLLPDGSTCMDIWASIDKASKTQRWCGGRKCHAGDGCPHNQVIISSKDFVNTLRHQHWFIERCEALLLKHTREYFDEYIAPAMRFTFGLTRYVQTANPEMYRQAEQILAAAQVGDE